MKDGLRCQPVPLIVCGGDTTCAGMISTGRHAQDWNEWLFSTCVCACRKGRKLVNFINEY